MIIKDDNYIKFKKECKKNIKKNANDLKWVSESNKWLFKAFINKHMYNFESLGRPIIQLPNDIIAIQELIWEIRPDLIVETGIAHGGSLIMSASMLALLDICDAIKLGKIFDPKNSNRKVLGIDIDIRKHNREAIENHPLSSRIQLLQGSSIDIRVIEEVKKIRKKYDRVLVCLDSNHTHEHVLAELNAYAPLTSIDSYCIVFDTFIENMPKKTFLDRDWGVGNNPKTAIIEYLKNHPEFKIDKDIDNKLMISSAPDGYLKRISK